MRKIIYKNEIHPDIFGSLNKIGEIHRNLGNFEAALKVYNEALEICKSI